MLSTRKQPKTYPHIMHQSQIAEVEPSRGQAFVLESPPSSIWQAHAVVSPDSVHTKYCYRLTVSRIRPAGAAGNNILRWITKLLQKNFVELPPPPFKPGTMPVFICSWLSLLDSRFRRSDMEVEMSAPTRPCRVRRLCDLCAPSPRNRRDTLCHSPRRSWGFLRARRSPPTPHR